MIPQEQVKIICEQYALDDMLFCEEINEGVLNKNYVLVTKKGKYFVKSLRGNIQKRVEYIFQVESFMAEKGIPAIVMRKTLGGQSSVSLGNSMYLVYDFIESDRSHEYSPLDYEHMGQMLAEMHKAGSTDVPDTLKQRVFSAPIKEEIIKKFEEYISIIESKGSLKDKTDELFLKYIKYKLSILSTVSIDLSVQNDTLVHDDFQTGNILIDKTSRKIIGVCDWEKAMYGSRRYDLARAVLYICFNVGFKHEEAVSRARDFLRGYLSVYPMDREEIRTGFLSRVRRTAYATWLEDKYYKDHDDRANKFVENEMRTMKLFIDEGFDPEIFFS